MGTIKSKIDRKFEQKRKANWVNEKANLVKAYRGTKFWGQVDTMDFSFWIVANMYLYFDVVVQTIHIILEIC